MSSKLYFYPLIKTEQKTNENLSNTYPNIIKLFENFNLSHYEITQITDSIFLGNISGAMNCDLLKKNNIKYIVNCTKNIPNKCTDMIYYNIPIDDTYNQNIENYFDPSYNFIEKSLENKDGNIFIHCHAGVSRSVTILVSYLMKKNNMTVIDAIRFIKNKRDIVNPNPDFRLALSNYMN